MTTYLAEALRLASSSAPFAVLAHIDYPLRYWPTAAGPFDAARYEDEYRAVLAALASSGRALEINTRVCRSPLRSCAGGMRPAVKQRPSEATPTSRRPWPGASPKPPLWPKQPASTPAAIRTTSGFARHSHHPRPISAKRDFAALPND